MSFEVKVKTGKEKDKVATKIGIDITQDGKPFYKVDHTWAGIKDADQARFQETLAPLLGLVGITASGDGVIGPIEEDEMIALEVGMTSISKNFNKWAIEDAKSKGRATAKAEAAMAKL